MLNYVKIYINRKYKVWWSVGKPTRSGVYLWMLYVSSTYQYIDNVKIKRINDINKLISVNKC